MQIRTSKVIYNGFVICRSPASCLIIQSNCNHLQWRDLCNFKALKIELEQKYGPIKWQSNTDTEVIVEGFARENIAFLNKLNGIFSLIIYDTKSQNRLC